MYINIQIWICISIQAMSHRWPRWDKNLTPWDNNLTPWDKNLTGEILISHLENRTSSAFFKCDHSIFLSDSLEFLLNLHTWISIISNIRQNDHDPESCAVLWWCRLVGVLGDYGYLYGFCVFVFLCVCVFFFAHCVPFFPPLMYVGHFVCVRTMYVNAKRTSIKAIFSFVDNHTSTIFCLSYFWKEMRFITIQSSNFWSRFQSHPWGKNLTPWDKNLTRWDENLT